MPTPCPQPMRCIRNTLFVAVPGLPAVDWIERVMVEAHRKRRYTATPSRLEVNIRAIPLLPKDGWKLLSLDEFPLVGTVPKNYLSYGDPRNPRSRGFIAKKGRTSNDARECVTEEIISKIGSMLPLEVAESKLVRLSKTDVRFLSQNFVSRDDHELLHGIELAARYFETDREDVETTFNLENKAAEQQFYTVDNVLAILESLFARDFSSLKEAFFKMLAFDAFVGAHDRHGMNWGVLIPFGSGSAPVRFAPIFDTARGLFREFSDDRLRLREKGQGRNELLVNYAERSSPILSTGLPEGQNHFSLIRWIKENDPNGAIEAMCQVFGAVSMSSIEHMLQRKFRRIITQYRIGLIRDLLSHRIQRIQEELQL